jgi:predicted phosphodiesterase
MAKNRQQGNGDGDVDDLISKVNPPENVRALLAQNRRLRQALSEYKREHGMLENMMDEVMSLIPALQPRPSVFKPQQHQSSPLTAILHVTDIHYGAMQEQDEIEGFGRFSPQIATARMHGLMKDEIQSVELHRNSFNVPSLAILITGDLVSGDIHEELRVTNAFPVPAQAIGVTQLLCEMIQMAEPHFETIDVHMITDDNHGRLTKKPQAKEAGINNWCYVAGNMLARSFHHTPNVKINVYPMNQKVVNVNGYRYLMCHGHDIMGWMGFPYYGIERRAAREALKRMNAPDFTKFDAVLLGHWHAPMRHLWYRVGGSVSGTDAFDHKQGRHAQPIQVSWFIHPKWGEFDVTEWQLNKHDPV